MTTVYGAWVPNASTNQRMRLRLDYSVPTPTAGQTSVTVTGTCYVEAGYSFEDTSNTFTVSGTLLSASSGAKSINVATGGAQSIHTFSQAVTLTDATQDKTVGLSLTGINYVGASVIASLLAYITIPARAVTVPNAPTGAAVTRVSDTRHDLSWTVTTTTDKPVTSWDVERWDLASGNYAPAANPDGGARAWVDSGTVANNEYEWRIRSRNAAGVSAWVYFPVIWTTPAAPTNVTVVRNGSDAVVSWTINARDATHQDLRVQSSTDGGATWSAWAWVSGHTGFAANLTTRIVSGGLDPVKLHRLGVVAFRSNPSPVPGLYGYSATSAPLQLLTAPSAPLLLAPLGVTATNQPTVMSWQHRPVDTTAQTAAEVQWRPVGGSWTTITATTAQQVTVAANTWAAGTYEWQVRTKGAHASWSPYSTLASFRVAAPPATAISTGSSVTSNRLTLTFSYTDPQAAAMTGWRANLSLAGQVIETISGTGPATSATFAALLTNATAYTAQVWVTSGSGLTSAPASWLGTTAFALPPVPTLTAVWDEPTGTVQLVASAPAPGGGEVAATSLRIDRSADGATWATVADGLPLGAGVGDDRVPLNIAAQYRAMAKGALGTERSSTIAAVTTATSRAWIQSSRGRISLIHNLAPSATLGQERKLERYLGDESETAHYGRGKPVSVSLSGVLLDAELTQDPALLLGEDVWIRDPTGRALWGSIASVSTSEPYAGRRDVALTVDRVTHG